MDYEEILHRTLGENEPNLSPREQSQFVPSKRHAGPSANPSILPGTGQVQSQFLYH
jgi:hypothetical protein